MDATTLRETQAPLKQRYRDDPATAATALHARGSFDDPGVTCTVQGWAGPVRAGLHEAAGGDGADAWSGRACASRRPSRSAAASRASDLAALRLFSDASGRASSWTPAGALLRGSGASTRSSRC